MSSATDARPIAVRRAAALVRIFAVMAEAYEGEIAAQARREQADTSSPTDPKRPLHAEHVRPGRP